MNANGKVKGGAGALPAMPGYVPSLDDDSPTTTRREVYNCFRFRFFALFLIFFFFFPFDQLLQCLTGMFLGKTTARIPADGQR